MFVVVIPATSTARSFGSYEEAVEFFRSVTQRGREAHVLRRNTALRLGFMPEQEKKAKSKS